MYVELKRFLNHSSVYLIGNTLNRLGIFALLPLYTNYLTPKEYGTLELVLVTVAIMRVFLGMRLGHATLRFFFEYKGESDKNKLISTSFLAITFWCLILVLALMYFSSSISRFVYGSEAYNMLFVIGFSVMFFEVINEIPFAFFRAKEYSRLYVLCSLSQLILRVAFNIYIVIYLHGGIKGILLGNLFASSLLWLFLCCFIFKASGFAFDIKKLKDLWKYSYPLIIASLPSLVMRNADRIFLGWYVSLGAVGLYALAIRFGMALQGFVLEPFQLGYGPFRFSIMNQKNAKEIYSRILTYFLLLATFVGLLIALLSREILELMTSEIFRSTYKIVPLILFATIVGGVAYIFQTGLLIEKKTRYIPYITVTTAISNILVLFILVPPFGVYGAAFSLIISQFIEMALIYKISQRLYRISFEYQRLTKIIVVALFIYFMSMLTDGMGLTERLSIKTCIILTFPFLLILLRFYKNDEVEKFFVLKKKVSMKAFSAFNFIRSRSEL